MLGVMWNPVSATQSYQNDEFDRELIRTASKLNYCHRIIPQEFQ